MTLVTRVAPALFDVRSVADLPGAFQALGLARVDALALHPFTWPDVRDGVVAANLPVITTIREATLQGAMMAHYTVAATDEADRNQRLSAGYMDRILNGAKVADLRPARVPPDEYRIAVHVTTANSLGVTLPDSILSRAERVG